MKPDNKKDQDFRIVHEDIELLSRVGNRSSPAYLAHIDDVLAAAVSPTHHLDSNGDLRRFGRKKMQEVGLERLFQYLLGPLLWAVVSAD